MTSAGDTSDESGSDSIQALLDELLSPVPRNKAGQTADRGGYEPTTGEPTGGDLAGSQTARPQSGGAPAEEHATDSRNVDPPAPATDWTTDNLTATSDAVANEYGYQVGDDATTRIMDRPIGAAREVPTSGPPPVITYQPGDNVGASTGGRSGAASTLTMVVMAVLGLYAVLVAAWSIDLFRHQDEVMRGIEFADTSLQGMDRSAVVEVVERRNGALAERLLEVSVGDVTVGTDPVAVGVTVDSDAIIDDAFGHGRSGFFPFRPVTWLGSFLATEVIEEVYTINADRTVAAAQELVMPALDQPREPELLLQGEQMVVTPGEQGTTVNPRELVGLLPDAMDRGEPYRVSMQSVVAEPTIDESAVRAIADEINSLTATALRIKVLDESATVDPETLKSWVILDVEGGPSWSFETGRVLNDLRPLFPTLGSEDQKARFNVVDDEPIIIPASETVVCCDEGSFDRIRQALEAGPSNVVEAGDGESDSTGDGEEGEAGELPVAVLEPEIVGADQGVAELESLGIVEQVSTFTTNHACCQNRVTNIHRIADLTRGAIIRPGETFSLNGFVGRRTRDNGFVADGAIHLGVLEPQVGGGISQYATTLFNAAFYAGMEFVEYQSHSLYISRYPRGREATISWPRPDLKIKNTTDYGILLWNSYTSTSITVTMYSTKHLDVVDLPLRRSSDRQCRIDITPREITYPDGTTVEDTVLAVYRPGEGLDCNGDSTRPEPAQDGSNETTETAPADNPPADDPPADPPADDPPADPPADDPPADNPSVDGGNGDVGDDVGADG